MAEDASTATMITHLCQVCGIRTTYWCSRCHTVWYCSVEHMQYDWSTHRSYCRPFDGSTEPSVGGSSTAASSQVPSPNNQYSPLLPIAPRDTSGRGPPPNGPGFQQAPLSTHPINGTRNMSPSGPATTSEFDSVLFPWNEERPRIVRVPCLAQPQNSGPTIWTPMPQEQLGGIENITSMIITHGIGGAPLRFPLHLFYGSASFGDGSPINRTIERMTGGKATYPWAGNIVALKFSGSRRQGYTDATYNDVAPLIASFLARPGEQN